MNFYLNLIYNQAISVNNSFDFKLKFRFNLNMCNTCINNNLKFKTFHKCHMDSKFQTFFQFRIN